MSRPPVVPDRRAALIGGVLMAAGAAFLLTDAYERRGRKRPWFLRLIPGA